MKRQIPSRLLGALPLVTGLTLWAAPQAASAADLPARVAPPPPIFVVQDWTGFYLGGQIGVVADGKDRSFASGDGGLNIQPGFGGRGGRTGNAVGVVKGRDLFTGGHLGYNWQIGGAVFGLEADVSGLGPIDDLLGSGRARLGFGTPTFLVYGTAGVAFQALNATSGGVFVGGNGGNGGNGGPGGDAGAGGNGFGTLSLIRPASDRVGFVGGGGIETKLAPQVSAGFEALYYVFDGSPAFTGLPNDFVSVRGRLSFHLQPTGPAAPGALGPVSWGGFYGGGHFGGITNLSPVIGSTALADGENGSPGTRGIDGGGGGGGAVAFAGLQRNPSVIGGVHLGYNWQAGGFVYGGEGDFGVSTDENHRLLGSVRARLGFTSGSFLVYGTGGAAFNDNEATRAIFATNGGNGGNGGAVILAPGGAGGAGGQALAFTKSDTQVGFVVGAGLESKITDRISVGLEGLYYNFGKASAVPAPAAPGRGFTAGSLDALVVRTRLSWSFATP